MGSGSGSGSGHFKVRVRVRVSVRVRGLGGVAGRVALRLLVHLGLGVGARVD